MTNYIYSSAGLRFASVLADNLLFAVVVTIPTLLILNLYFSNYDYQPTNGFVRAFLLLLKVFYYAFFYSSKQQATPGQQYLSIKIIHENGSRLTFSRGLCRTLIDYIVHATLILGIVSVFMIIYRKKKQGIADTICKTIIVDKDSVDGTLVRVTRE